MESGAATTSSHKTCTKCNEEKSTSDFYKDLRASHGLQSWCKKCMNKQSRDYDKRNPDYHKNKKLERNYGISREEYDSLLASQENVCAICGKEPKRFNVDHDHKTGKVRGLLCSSCNTGLGKLGDSMEGLMKAYKYLEKANER